MERSSFCSRTALVCMDEGLGPMAEGGLPRVSARRKPIGFGTIRFGAVLFMLVSAATSQGSPTSITGVLQTQALREQLAQAGTGPNPRAGLGSLAAPTLIVQPGPPPVPIGEPELRRPVPPTDSRPALPNFESDDDAAKLRIGPSVEGPDKLERDTAGKKAGAKGNRQP